MTEVAIAWFRRDLRLNDNPALAAACASEAVVPVFCFERALHSGRHASANRNAYLLASLRELDERLRAAGSRLHIRSGNPAVQLARLARECGAVRVHVNRDHTAHARLRDRRVAARLQEDGIELVGHGGITCATIETIETGSGVPYRVFTPFHGAWSNAGRRELAVRPRKIDSPSIAAESLPSPESLGVGPRARRVAAAFGAGETAARKGLREAIAATQGYDGARDVPGEDATTRLSPHLHFGTVSP